MKISKIFIIPLLFIQIVSFACDECSTFDYTNIQGKDYFGIYYRYRQYNGYTTLDHDPQFKLNQSNYQNAKIAHIPIEEDELTYIPSRYDYEVFKTVELRYSHTFGDWLNVLVVVPYNINTLYFKEILPEIGSKFDSVSTNKGFGDITIGASRILEKENKGIEHRFVYGLALTIPTGKFQILNDEDQLQDPDHQPGKGAWDFTVRANYIFNYREKWGIRSFINYASSNMQEYDGSRAISFRQGNRTNAMIDYYYPIGLMNFKFIPAAGFYFENSAKDRLNSNDWDDTGGSILFLSIMPEFKYKEFRLRPQVMLPLVQRLNGEQLQNSGRINLAMLYSF